MGLANALQFTAGNDIESGSLLVEQAQDRQRRIGFDGITDGRRLALEGIFKELKALGDLLRGLDIERRDAVSRKGRETSSVAVKGAVAIDEGTRAWLRRDFFGQTRCSL